MATINLIPNKRKEERAKGLYDSKENNTIHSVVYNTTRWRKLRINYLVNNPICEECKLNLSIDVHHITHISEGRNKDDMKRIGFNEKNLMALCKECHKEKHKIKW